VGTSRGENGRTTVTFAWEPVPAGSGARPAADESPTRVVLTATAVDGRPLFRGRVPEEAPAGMSADGGGTTPSAKASGSQISFDAPPGQVQMRMVVEGPRGQVIDSAARELTLPDFTTVQVSLGTPQVFRARTPREVQTARKSPDALPTADRSFSRTDRLFIRTSAYAPGGAVPAITAKLLNRSGEPMTDIPLETPAPGKAEIEFALSNLAPGDYLLQLVAKTDAGTAEEYVAFRVGR
jgi:hypothetical protein